MHFSIIFKFLLRIIFVEKKVLVVGSGGREHAIAWKLRQSAHVRDIFCAPGNAGTAQIATNVDIKADDISGLLNFAKSNGIDLTVVGPEAPLVAGIVDEFEKAGMRIFGPSRLAARLEGSKIFAKQFMKENGIPTADFRIFDNAKDAKDHASSRSAPMVIKADGLAAGKGVIVCKSVGEALDAIDKIMIKKDFGDAGNNILVEDFLSGEEASILTITDGKNFATLLPSQDHKRILDNDRGENTGGMGAYAPAPIVDAEMSDRIEREIIIPTIRGMPTFKGCLYSGIMFTEDGPKVLEYNCRFGDPETQPVLSLLETDFYELLESSAAGKMNSTKVRNINGAACCVVMASGGYPGHYEKGKAISGLENPPKDVFVFHAGTAIKDGNVVTSGGRVLGVTGVGKDIPSAIKNAYSGVERIKWDGEYHRSDIGQKALKRLN
jgi:phosphoribosylamine---glycine ligase